MYCVLMWLVQIRLATIRLFVNLGVRCFGRLGGMSYAVFLLFFIVCYLTG